VTDPSRTSRTSPTPARYLMPRLLTGDEAAVLLRVRKSTVMDLARRGVVPSVRIGRAVRFVEADLVAYVDRLRRS